MMPLEASFYVCKNKDTLAFEKLYIKPLLTCIMADGKLLDKDHFLSKYEVIEQLSTNDNDGYSDSNEDLE
jgi:hypothetical protein